MKIIIRDPQGLDYVFSAPQSAEELDALLAEFSYSAFDTNDEWMRLTVAEEEIETALHDPRELLL